MKSHSRRTPVTHSILSTETASFDITPLRSLLTGDFVVPGDPDWDTARRAWNLAVDQRPAAVVLPESAADVATVVDFAREARLRVAPQGTGHAALPLGPLEDTILL